jgi:hypothetical protein
MKVQYISDGKRINGVRLQPVIRKRGGSMFDFGLNQATVGIPFGNSGLRDITRL